MYLKRKLMKAASICSYIFTGLWLILSACCFALSNHLYWLFLIFGFTCLYNGFMITSVSESMTSVTLEDHTQNKFLLCWIISILCPPAFVLNGIAFFRKTEDELVVIRQNVDAEKTRRSEEAQPLHKTKAFIAMWTALAIVFLSGFSAMCVETSGFSVKVSDFKLTRSMTCAYNNGEIHGNPFVLENDTSYAVTMYVPKTASEENPAPTVFVLPGFTRTKATMSQYCIELARRGFVVFCMDPGGQGGTNEPSTAGANGIEYLVQYVYNNTDNFKFCDKTRFGAVGHSAGGGNVCTLASDMAGENYQESVIKSLYISGYIKTSSAKKYENLNCNAALSYAYYDEGAFRYQTDDSAFEVISLRFINEVRDAQNSFDKVAYDYGYGDMETGTYRIVHRENINHCFEMYDGVSIANTIEFFDESLGMNSGISGHSQIWFWKELSNGLALAAAFVFIISLCGVLMKTPFFATLNSRKKGNSPPVLKSYTVSHKVIFWSSILITAIIACLDYIPLANLSIEIFPVGNSSKVFTFVFPARMINAVLLWALINGTIGLVIFFGTTIAEWVYEKTRAKNDRTALEAFDWGKFESIKIRGGDQSGALLNTLKAVLLALLLFGAFYFLVQVSYWIFHQDFRFMLVSSAPLNKRMFVTALEYIPILFVFYISNSIRVNCSIGREGWSEWKTLLVSALANSIGLAFILLINYTCYFVTGTPFYGYWGNGTEIWLYVNMVFGLLVMMFLLPIFNRLFYIITNNVWTGAITCCMIFVTMTISASVSYIPI